MGFSASIMAGSLWQAHSGRLTLAGSLVGNDDALATARRAAPPPGPVPAGADALDDLAWQVLQLAQQVGQLGLLDTIHRALAQIQAERADAQPRGHGQDAHQHLALLFGQVAEIAEVEMR